MLLMYAGHHWLIIGALKYYSTSSNQIWSTLTKKGLLQSPVAAPGQLFVYHPNCLFVVSVEQLNSVFLLTFTFSTRHALMDGAARDSL